MKDSAEYYFETGQYSKSEKCAYKALASYKKIKTEYSELQLLIAKIKFEEGAFDSSQIILEHHIRILESAASKQSKHYYQTLADLAKVLYTKQGAVNFQKADSLLQVCFMNEGSHKKINRAKMSELYHLQAQLYEKQGDYPHAEVAFIEALRQDSIARNSSTRPHALTLGSLGALYLDTNELEKSDSLMTRCVEILKNEQNPNYTSISAALINLAAGKYFAGNPEAAMLICEECKQLMVENGLEKTNDFARNLNLLAVINDDYGLTERTEEMYLHALEIYENNNSTQTEEYFSALVNIGGLYKSQQNYAEAEAYYLKALDIIVKIKNDSSMEYVNVCNNLGSLYTVTADYDKAAKYLNIALNVVEKTVGKTHAAYSGVLTNLARIYFKKKDFKTAYTYIKTAYEISKNVFGSTGAEYAKYSSNLLIIATISNYFEEAQTYFFEQNESIGKFYTSDINLLNEAEMTPFIQRYARRAEAQMAYVYKFKTQSQSLTGQIYDLNLLLKNLSFRKIKSYKSFSEQTSDTLIVNLYSKLVLLKDELNYLYSIPIAERNANTDSLLAKLDETETRLIRRVNLTFKDETRLWSANDTVNWKMIQHHLQPDEAAVEFIRFETITDNWTDTVMYCALIITKEAEFPHLAALCSESDLQKTIVKQSHFSEYEYIYNLYAHYETGANLYRMMWQPMDTFLTNVRKIYVSKIGILNQISLSAIPVSDKEILADKYEIHNLSSTAELVNRRKLYASELKTAQLYGGIQYSKDTANIAMLKNFSLGFLPGSLEEISDINTILKKNNIETTLLTAEQGTEYSIKNCSDTKNDLLHISTHGFYFSEHAISAFLNNTKFDTVAFENKMNRSGLLFSEIQHQNIRQSNSEDGILTALEISNLTLQNTKLAVLSACQTGLGGGESENEISGLIRAFKLAGAQKLIVSLWHVPDVASQYLFSSMYRNFSAGDEIETAFRKAQNELRLTKKFKNPYYWAGFILLD